MTTMQEMTQAKWAYFKGFIVTCNDDGSIPLNAKVVMDISLLSQSVADQAERVVSIHNEMLKAIK